MNKEKIDTVNRRVTEEGDQQFPPKEIQVTKEQGGKSYVNNN